MLPPLLDTPPRTLLQPAGFAFGRYRHPIAAALLACACSSAPPAPRPAPTSAPAPAPASALAPSPAPQPAPAPSADPPPSLPATACRPLGLAKACVSPAPHAWLESDAIAAWYQTRGAKPPREQIEPSCHEITLGAEAALHCEGIQHESRGKAGTPLHTYRVLTLFSVRVVRNKRAVVVFETPIRFDVLDKEDVDKGSLFELAIDSKSQFTELVLREPSDGACDEARAALRRHRDAARAENDPSQVAWARLDEELRSRLCRAIGKYALKGGRLERAAPVSTRFSSGP